MNWRNDITATIRGWRRRNLPQGLCFHNVSPILLNISLFQCLQGFRAIIDRTDPTAPSDSDPSISGYAAPILQHSNHNLNLCQGRENAFAYISRQSIRIITIRLLSAKVNNCLSLSFFADWAKIFDKIGRNQYNNKGLSLLVLKGFGYFNAREALL